MTVQRNHKLAKNLKIIMNDRSLLQKEVAKKCRITQGTVSKLINGKLDPTCSILIDLCKGLKVSPSRLLGYW